MVVQPLDKVLNKNNASNMRLDKTAFIKQSHADAADHQRCYARMSPQERGESFRYLMSVNFGFVGRDWPKMDKTLFHARKHS